MFSTFAGSEQQLKDMTLGDLIGKRKRAHTNYTEGLVIPSKITRKDNGSKTPGCASFVLPEVLE